MSAPVKSLDFEKALKELPRYIGGFDAWAHKNPDDLAWLVLLQIDLKNEGEDSEIKTQAQLERCKRYYNKYKKPSDPTI